MSEEISEKPKMKDCFGVSMGWFMEDLVGDTKDRQKCYECQDFERCYQMMVIKTTVQLRFELRRAARTVGLAIGGVHSSQVF